LVALDRKIPQVNFVNTPLKKALDDLRDMSSANLYVPWKVLNDAGATESTPVNVRVRDVPLSRALSLVLADATGGENRLTYNVEGGVIEIISRDMDARLEGFNTKLEAFTSRVEGPAVLHWDSRFPKTNIVRWGGPDSPLGLLRYQNQVGKTIRLRVSGSTDGEIWGNEIYSLDSEPGVAAVHAGLLQPGQEGTATIRILPGMARYSGLSRNGVSSLPFGAYPGSYRFEGMADVIPWVSFDPDTFSTTGGVRGYSMNGALFLFPNPEVMEKRGHLGETFEVEVTGSTEGTIWGTGVYTDDSPVATAAVHAGLLKPGERGKVRVTILPGRSSYEGSLRNGIRSDAFDSFEGSYRLEPVK
jgi:hypothetical protein